MKTILDKIIRQKQFEIQELKRLIPLSKMEGKVRNREHFSLKEALNATESSGIIAEFKRKSPSKNWINKKAVSTEIVSGYEVAGASGASILTDNLFFGGNNKDLKSASDFVKLPLLRKDFMVDEYQIIEANKMGADVILLIAACLSPSRVKELASLAHDYQLEVLLEVHNEQELDCICDVVSMVGVNNRNLKTFETSIENSIALCEKIPEDYVKISESGISNAQDIKLLKNYGYKGFLVGESFMKSRNPGKACAEFIQNLK